MGSRPVGWPSSIRRTGAREPTALPGRHDRAAGDHGDCGDAGRGAGWRCWRGHAPCALMAAAHDLAAGALGRQVYRRYGRDDRPGPFNAMSRDLPRARCCASAWRPTWRRNAHAGRCCAATWKPCSTACFRWIASTRGRLRPDDPPQPAGGRPVPADAGRGRKAVVERVVVPADERPAALCRASSRWRWMRTSRWSTTSIRTAGGPRRHRPDAAGLRK